MLRISVFRSMGDITIAITTAVAALLIGAKAIVADPPKAIAQTSAVTPQPTSKAQFFSTVILQLRTSTHVPVYLPHNVPFQSSPLYATVFNSSSSSYDVEISTSATCNASAWCHLGMISGFQSSVAPPLSGATTTTLKNGTVAYLNAMHCGAGCGDSSYTFLIGA
jgi:hypothetical protein